MTDARGGTSHYNYDALGRVTSMCDASIADCTLGNYTASYTYNDLGQQETVTDANGNTTSYSYDELGRPDAITYADNSVETIAYNARGQRIATSYGGYGTAYTYDDIGRLISTCQTVGNICQQVTATYSYDARGRQIATTNANGVTSRMVYDDANRVQMQIANVNDGGLQDPSTWAWNGTNWTDGTSIISHGVQSDSNIITAYTYDDLGRRETVRDVNGNLSTYHYQSMTNRLESTQNPDGTTVSYAYDALGRRTGMTDENGNTTNYGYDPLGRLTSVQNPEGETVRYGYDDSNNVTSITNGRNNTINFAYDALNRLIGKCDAEGNYDCTGASRSYTTEYLYDSNGNMIQEILADNTVNAFYYDDLNRLSYEVYDVNTANEMTYGYDYNSRGMLENVYSLNPTMATVNDILSTYSYDALGRPIEVSQDDGQSIHYGYDALGNRTLMETRIDNGAGDETQTFVTYDYDALNRVSAVRDHDPANLPATANDWATDTNADVTAFQHNTIGLLTTIARPNGVTTNYSYDPQRYFVDEIEHLDNITVLSRYNYSYDDVGNRTSTTITADDLSQTVHSYDYDDAYRLITETTNMGSANLVTNYQYDRAGNRTQMSNGEGITSYNYNANDELTRVDKPDFYFEDYSYDLRGNLIQVEAGGHGTYSSTNYAYNAKDQMVSYGLGSTPFITYDYNHADNRIAQTISGTTTNYLWDEFSRYKDVILETNPSNTIGYTLAGGMLVSQTNNGNTGYFMQDAQNSTVGMTDSSGAVTSSYAYDAFGNLDSSISGLSVETNYLYTGQQFDPVYTELYNLRARQYDPSIGRFSSRDKWAYDYQNPVELNRYGYAHNNPVNFYDPTGYEGLVFQGMKISTVDVLVLGVALLGYACSTSKTCIDRGSDIAQDALDALPSLDDIPWGKLSDAFGTLKRLWDLVRALQNVDRFLKAISDSSENAVTEEVATVSDNTDTESGQRKNVVVFGAGGIGSGNAYTDLFGAIAPISQLLAVQLRYPSPEYQIYAVDLAGGGITDYLAGNVNDIVKFGIQSAQIEAERALNAPLSLSLPDNVNYDTQSINSSYSSFASSQGEGFADVVISFYPNRAGVNVYTGIDAIVLSANTLLKPGGEFYMVSEDSHTISHVSNTYGSMFNSSSTRLNRSWARLHTTNPLGLPPFVSMQNFGSGVNLASDFYGRKK